MPGSVGDESKAAGDEMLEIVDEALSLSGLSALHRVR